jgi:hypothetical protein
MYPSCELGLRLFQITPDSDAAYAKSRLSSASPSHRKFTKGFDFKSAI